MAPKTAVLLLRLARGRAGAKQCVKANIAIK